MIQQFMQFKQFQSTFPRGERRLIPCRNQQTREFQSTFPRGERRIQQAINADTVAFQSTFPRGERQQRFGGYYYILGYFNPRSLVGNDHSSHLRSLSLANFNPRSLVGNDGGYNDDYSERGNFNPRSLVGNDRCSTTLSGLINISIHVPSWGTTAEDIEKLNTMLFQSTFPRGERQGYAHEIICVH